MTDDVKVEKRIDESKEISLEEFKLQYPTAILFCLILI